MLRIGLTGELGSGKSTVARLLASRGAVTLSSDEMGRALMQPGEPSFDAIAARFGPTVLAADGTLDRAALARLAFDPHNPRVRELEAIVHPAVIDAQLRRLEEIAATNPHAIVVVESALIFTTPYAPAGTSWRDRFDLVVLVTAPDADKIARAMARATAGRTLSAPERDTLLADIRHRLAAQTISPAQAASCFQLTNHGSLADLEEQTDALWQRLRRREAALPSAPR